MGKSGRLLHLLVGEVLVAGKDIALELVHVGIPELGSLTIEGRGTEKRISNGYFQDRGLTLLVGLAEQALQRQKHRADVQDGAPLVLENIQADATLHVDIGVVDGSGEADLRRYVRIAGREVEAQLESEPGVGSIGGSHDGTVPDSEVAVMRECTDTRGGGCHQRHELALQAVLQSVSGLGLSGRARERRRTA